MDHYYTIRKKQLVFVNEILKKICGNVFDNELNIWRKKKIIVL